ncbi:hypothetical protein QTG54_013083 [Skeletonema marinoi]|uniref:Uncharacterized protein n=1 Tax=Skeletonema marinoi TaxID=267567 RepID=A0AAD9D8D1_9STRA|nr:hypothetical protein QTG54_013083 [Skeletonema marinoi]
MKHLLGLSTLLMCLVRASSFSLTQFSPATASSSSSLHAYHFGAGAVNTEKPADIKQRKRYTSYVPDGLSEVEYTKIKLEEYRKQQKMQYGAWGPRFKQVDGDPDNNWFNLPSLWTTGFNSNPNALSSSRSADIGGETATVFARMLVNLRRFLLPYMTLLLSVYLLEVSITAKNILQPMLRGKFIISKYMMIRVLAPMLALKPLEFFASKLGWGDKNGTTKLTFAVGLVLSTISLVLQRRV